MMNGIETMSIRDLLGYLDNNTKLNYKLEFDELLNRWMICVIGLKKKDYIRFNFTEYQEKRWITMSCKQDFRVWSTPIHDMDELNEHAERAVEFFDYPIRKKSNFTQLNLFEVIL